MRDKRAPKPQADARVIILGYLIGDDLMVNVQSNGTDRRGAIELLTIALEAVEADEEYQRSAQNN